MTRRGLPPKLRRECTKHLDEHLNSNDPKLAELKAGVLEVKWSAWPKPGWTKLSKMSRNTIDAVSARSKEADRE